MNETELTLGLKACKDMKKSLHEIENLITKEHVEQLKRHAFKAWVEVNALEKYFHYKMNEEKKNE